jgi:hypothetical protein
VALAINIRSDNDSAGEIERLWDQAAMFEAEPSMRALGYRPHFTFAIYDSPAADEKAAWDVMLAATAGETQLRITFERIRWFEGSPLVLWAEPEIDETLARNPRRHQRGNRSSALSPSLPARRLDTPLHARHCHCR